MFKSKRIIHFLVLAVFFSFFTYTFTSFILIFSHAIELYLSETFLSLFISMFGTFINLIFIMMNFLAKIFFAGSTIGLLIVLWQDGFQKVYVK